MRCTCTTDLEVHHKRRDGGNKLENAIVLCQPCHANTATYGVAGESPPEFDKDTKFLALFAAGMRCQCEKDDCH